MKYRRLNFVLIFGFISLIRMKLVLVIRTLPFAVLDFISGLHNINMDKMFPNSPRIPTMGMTTPRITNVRTDPEIYGTLSPTSVVLTDRKRTVHF